MPDEKHSLLLVHSPLVGPSSFRRLADLADAEGVAVVLPDLTPATRAAPPMWERFVELAVYAAGGIGSAVTVVGHSGAGALLPSIGDALSDRLRGLVFVDAVLPPESGIYHSPAGMVDSLGVEDENGLLLPWLDWWPAAVVEDLLPDPDDRSFLANDMPRLPRAFYDEAIPMPEGWVDQPGAFLLLSDAYRDEFAEAGRRGWPRQRLDCNHLSTHTDPELVLDGIISVSGFDR